MTSLRNKLGREEVISLELTPPHGATFNATIERFIGAARGRVDILGVTDNAMAKVRMGAVACAHTLQTRYGIDAMVNLGMRDRNRLALQADLLGAHVLGLRTVVALKGDPASAGNQPDAREVFEGNALLLLDIIRTLNGGHDMAGKKLHGATEFLAGTVTNPTADDRAAEAKRLARRAQAGAAFALTQPIYAPEQLGAFLDVCAPQIPKLLVGILPLKSYKFAHFLATKVPGVHIPDALMAAMRSAGGGVGERERGLKSALDVVAAIRRARHPAVAGFHIMTAGAEELAIEVLTRLRPAAHPAVVAAS